MKSAVLLNQFYKVKNFQVSGYNILEKESKEFTSRFDCDKIGELTEYVGCKIDHDKLRGKLKLLNLYCCRVIKMNILFKTISKIHHWRRGQY